MDPIIKTERWVILVGLFVRGPLAPEAVQRRRDPLIRLIL